MPEQIRKVHRRSHEEQVLRAQQRSEHESPSKIPPLLEKVERKQQKPHEESIILEVDVVDSEQRRRPQDERESEEWPLPLPRVPRQ